MAFDTVDQRVDIADILQSTADDGEIRVTLGDSTTNEGIGVGHMWGIDGFISRPNDPDEDGAAQGFFIYDSNSKRIISSRDNRFANKVGSMDPGDRAIVTNGAARVFVKQVRDAVTLFTESQPDSEAPIMVDLDGSNGVLKIVCAGSWIELTNDTVTIGVAGGAAVITFSADGLQIDAPYLAANCGGGNLGVLPGGIPPVAGVSSIVAGPTGMAGVGAPSWTVSPV